MDRDEKRGPSSSFNDSKESTNVDGNEEDSKDFQLREGTSAVMCDTGGKATLGEPSKNTSAQTLLEKAKDTGTTTVDMVKEMVQSVKEMGEDTVNSALSSMEQLKKSVEEDDSLGPYDHPGTAAPTDNDPLVELPIRALLASPPKKSDKGSSN